jgi:hypothetical protein
LFFGITNSWADALELPRDASILTGTVLDEEGITPKRALKYSRYIVPEFINSKERVKGDYYCYTNTIASRTEQLDAIEALSLAGFAFARKKSNAEAVASRSIFAFRCHAPSKSEGFELMLTGLVHRVLEPTADGALWEAIVLEGEAEINGLVQKVYVAKLRRQPIVS